MSSLSSTVQDVFNEPGCGKNQGKSEKEKKKGCTKQLQPGGDQEQRPQTQELSEREALDDVEVDQQPDGPDADEDNGEEQRARTLAELEGHTPRTICCCGGLARRG